MINLTRLKSLALTMAGGPGAVPSKLLLQWIREELVDKVEQRYRPTAVKTADYTASSFELVLVDASTGITVTLPPNPKHGDRVGYKNTTSDTTEVTIASSGSDTVDGDNSVTNSTAFGAEQFVYDAVRSDWMRL